MTQRNPRKAFAFLAVPAMLLLMAQPVLASPFPGGIPCADDNMSSLQIAQARPNVSPAEREKRRQYFIKALGLSPDQAQKIQAIKQQGREQSKVLDQQLHTKRQALMQYLQSPTANESQARAMNAEINTLQKQLSELRLKSWFSMRAIMTPEQLQKMKQLKPPGGRHPGGPENRSDAHPDE